MALSISISPDGQGFSLKLRSGHTVTIPANDRGIQALQTILSLDDANATETRIVQAATPIQYLVDQAIRAGRMTILAPRGQARPAKQASQFLSLQDLDL